MAVYQWNTPDATETIMTTELDGLADEGNAISSAISNDAATELDLFADFELYVATQAAARSAGAHVAMYILIELDGTNYTYGDATTDPPASAFVGSFPLDASANPRYVHLRGVRLPPTDFKVLLINKTGQALAASGNTLKMARYNIQVA